MKIKNTTIHEFIAELKEETGVEIYPDGDSVGMEIEIVEVKMQIARPTALQVSFVDADMNKYSVELDTERKEDAAKLFSYLFPFVQNNFDQN